RGTYGWREIERDAAQREIKTLALQRPTVGNTVALTIDDRLQKLLDAELRKGVEEDKFTQAVGVAMNPQNGEILAMVSIPGYDNNMFARGITTAELDALNADDRHPLVNKAIGDRYPAGSTFKLVTGLSALSEGTATRDTVVNVSASSFSVSGTTFYDWRAHGSLNFVTGFAHSSDIYFYTLAGGTQFAPSVRGVGPDAIAKYARMLGFGSPTGIDLPNEDGGIMPDPPWKLTTYDEPWTIGNAYMPNLKIPIAGKTGTAEFGASAGKDSAGRNKLGFHNWFVSFVPQADNTDPTAQIAMVIFTYDSSKSLCELCLNPAVGMTQRILEQYLGATK